MEKYTLFLWCKTDIASLIGCEVRILKDLISEETKKLIKWDLETPKLRRFKLNDILLILKDVYPFLTDQERLKILLPKPL